MKNNIGIMQGRLVPPLDGELQAFPVARWADEFTLAGEAGLDCIEWIFDLGTEEENPIWSEDGIAILNSLMDQSRVQLHSVCADYFMRRPLLDIPDQDRQDRLAVLDRLMINGTQVGISRIVIPFVDASSINTDRHRIAAVEIMQECAKRAARHNIELHLETDLAPAAFAAFLDRIAAQNVKVNYDSGNSASLGFKPTEELAAYGNMLGSVHIKDRTYKGGSVALGTGDADFAALFTSLRQLDYRGDFILQTARGKAEEEVALARLNRSMVEQWMAG